MRQREQAQSDTLSEPRHIVLAREAILAGMSRVQVIEALIKRIRRDEGYLAYRKASGRRTSYDELVTADMRALALAACWHWQRAGWKRRPAATLSTRGNVHDKARFGTY